MKHFFKKFFIFTLLKEFRFKSKEFKIRVLRRVLWAGLYICLDNAFSFNGVQILRIKNDVTLQVTSQTMSQSSFKQFQVS